MLEELDYQSNLQLSCFYKQTNEQKLCEFKKKLTTKQNPFMLYMKVRSDKRSQSPQDFMYSGVWKCVLQTQGTPDPVLDDNFRVRFTLILLL